MSEERPPASATVVGVVGAVVFGGIAIATGSFVAMMAAVVFLGLAKLAAGARTDEREDLARTLDDARVLPQGDEVLIEGLHRGERVWLEQSSAVPGTLCRIVCTAPPQCRGTIKTGGGGEPPRFVGGPTSTLPDALTSGEAGQALRALLERCPFVRVRASQIEVLVESAGDVRPAVDALTELTWAIRGAKPAELEVELRERETVTADCPYCRESLGELESIACGTCGTQHHLECLLEHGRCTVLACGGRAPRVREGG